MTVRTWIMARMISKSHSYSNIGSWTAPLEKDAVRPPPLCGFSFTKFDRHQAVLFGGDGPQGRADKLFVLDMSEKVNFILTFLFCLPNNTIEFALSLHIDLLLHWGKIH